MCDYELTQDEEQKLFDANSEKMYNLFPNLPFCADIEHLVILDDVVAESNDAIIYYKHNEYYYANFPTTPIELIYIKRDRHITYRDVYLECEMRWIHDNGNHIFLEGICVYDETHNSLTNTIIELRFGS